MIGLIIKIILGGPHLVLADFGGDNGLPLGQFIQFFDHILRLDRITSLLVGQGVGIFPFFNLIEPFFSFLTEIPQIDLIEQLV